MKTDIRHTIYEPRVTSHQPRAAVTLIEMLIVLAIITLLASMVIGMATHIGNQSRAGTLENTFGLLESALDEYREYTGRFPYAASLGDPNLNSERLYGALDSVPTSRKILERISDSLIRHNVDTEAEPPIPEIYDPWGNVLNYRYDVNTDTYPQLISAGPDRNFGTPDDVSNR